MRIFFSGTTRKLEVTKTFVVSALKAIFHSGELLAKLCVVAFAFYSHRTFVPCEASIVMEN